MMKRAKKNKKPINLKEYYTSFSVKTKKKSRVEVMCRHYDQDISQSYSHPNTLIEVVTPEHRGISPTDESTQASFEIHESFSHNEFDMWDSGGIAEDLGLHEDVDDYVEVLESYEYKPERKDADCGCNKNHHITTDEELKIKPEVSKDKPKIPSAKSSVEEQLSTFSDDDLLADMQSIIRGEKIFDKESGSMKERSEYTPSPPSSIEPQSMETGDESLDKLLAKKKNEHAIFDKIAESMQYANAYDLGSISLDKRFEEFDQIDALSKPNTQRVISEEPVYHEEDIPQKISSKEFIEDLDLIHKELGKKDENPRKSDPIPLDPGIGGMSIPASELKVGDIILSTTTDPISKLIKYVTNSEVSHAAMYVGDGFIVEAGEEGVLKLTLDTALASSTVAVAYRHQGITDAKRAKIIQFIDKVVKEKAKFDFKALVKILPSQLMKQYCLTKPENERAACIKLSEKLRFGTNNNNQFYCSELVVQALKAAELDIAQISPDWSTVQDIVELNHNGTLNYLGHLKT